MLYSSVRDNYLKDPALFNAFQEEMKHPTETVSYNGKTWTIGSKQFHETENRLSPWKVRAEKIKHFFKKIFSPKYKMVFEAVVNKLEEARSVYAKSAQKVMVVSSDLLQVDKSISLEQAHLDELHNKLKTLLAEKDDLLKTAPEEIMAISERIRELLLKHDELTHYLKTRKNLQEQRIEHQKEISAIRRFFGMKDEKTKIIESAEKAIHDEFPEYREKSIEGLDAELKSLEGKIETARNELDEKTKDSKLPLNQKLKSIVEVELQIQSLEKKIGLEKKAQAKLHSQWEKLPSDLKNLIEIPDVPLTNARIEKSALPIPERQLNNDAPQKAIALQEKLPDNPAPTQQFLEQIGNKTNPETKQIWSALLNRFKEAYGEDMVSQTYVNGNTITLKTKEKLMLWLSSTDEKGVQDPPGGVVLVLGDNPSHTVQFNIADNGRLEFQDGFTLVTKTPIYARLLGIKWAVPKILSLTISPEQKSVEITVGMHIRGKIQKRSRKKTIQEIVNSWGSQNVVITRQIQKGLQPSPNLSGELKPHALEIAYLTNHSK